MALRLATFLTALALVAGASSTPAGAYNCGGSAAPVRTLSSHASVNDVRDCARPAKPKARQADPISFAFFLGIIVAVLLVPIALGKREDAGPE